MINTPRKSPVDTVAYACPLCQGEMIAVEVAGAEERPSLIGENFGKHFSRDALVPLERAISCLGCGYVQFFVDPQKLRRRIAKKP